ncbi:hypothetical protein CEXT_408351 [Caerostris extrusa]|uniref:Uncharacterized protein n=1 Tax=Caerostris extrusa TaxID=172846 RepID=A0AAV4SEC0_CAEEX|nr:hypothetical protein CEXT_408351 [Caerostris extrusa]
MKSGVLEEFPRRGGEVLYRLIITNKYPGVICQPEIPFCSTKGANSIFASTPSRPGAPLFENNDESREKSFTTASEKKINRQTALKDKKTKRNNFKQKSEDAVSRQRNIQVTLTASIILQAFQVIQHGILYLKNTSEDITCRIQWTQVDDEDGTTQ